MSIKCGYKCSSWAKQIIYLGRTRWRNTYSEQVIETMFVQRFSLRLELGLREYAYKQIAYFLAFEIIHCLLLLQGWCTVNPKIWNTWADTDPRKEGSILQVGKIEQGTADYKGDKVS
jgi:hypothetical protein